ncbi:hypothetical protein V6N12_072564 [Hibiscus sabdariffa]|uniref:Cytochrome P450 n=1 Tax=Hibiscus sabdariffa TaxID=183260 RepID=A0ABR2AZR0_9ROSI
MDKKRRKVKIEEQNQINSAMDDHETPFLEPIWTRKAQERGGIGFQNTDAMDSEIGAATSKKIRPTFANPNALKLSCELVRIFITESVQRAATVAEAEGGGKPKQRRSSICLHRRHGYRSSETSTNSADFPTDPSVTCRKTRLSSTSPTGPQPNACGFIGGGGGKDLAFSPYGEYWRQVRKLSVVELFSHKRVELFQFVRDEEVELVASINGQPINLTKMVFFVSNNIVLRCALGRKFEEEDGDGDDSKFWELTKRVVVLLTGFCIGERKGLDEVNPTNDLLSLLLQLQKQGEIDMDLTQDNLKAILLDMFIGGSDTTSTTTEWLMAELLKHPNAMKKVQEEVRTVVGNKPKIEADDINKMEYLKCVVNETLRLHSTVPLLVPRQTSTAVKLFDYDIPCATTVFINAMGNSKRPHMVGRTGEVHPGEV